MFGRWTVLAMALRRLSVDRERILRLPIASEGSRLLSRVRIESFLKDLHGRCDGACLRQCNAVPAASAGSLTALHFFPVEILFLQFMSGIIASTGPVLHVGVML